MNDWTLPPYRFEEGSKPPQKPEVSFGAPPPPPPEDPFALKPPPEPEPEDPKGKGAPRRVH